MPEPQSETSSLDKDLCGIANLRRFRHAACAATFDVFIIHKDALYAGQAAQAAFNVTDRIEADLSKFIENSDVSRINSLGKGRSLQIGLSTFECLRTSVEMCNQTNGAFDVTFSSSRKGRNLIKLNESEHTVELLADGVQLDLGAIGKGYAADKMGQLLDDWGIDTALISAGQSTILPIGKPKDLPGWPLSLSDPTDYNRVLAKIYLADFAVSASGLQKGPHIIDPRSGKPARRKLAAWATAKTASTGRLSAASADALSTAFMVMPVDEIRAYCNANRDTSVLLIPSGRKKELIRFGRWDKTEFYFFK